MKIEKHWVINQAAPDLILSIAQDLGISQVMAKVLAARGFESSSDALAFIQADVELLENPFLLADMDKAVQRLRLAKFKKQHVFVAGDRDTDGVTSTTLLVNLLKEEEISHGWKVPTEGDGYGLGRSAVDAAIAEKADLIITVDCGISDFDGVAYARENKIDVVILDHHEPDAELPLAGAVVDPKRKDSLYPFRELSACGLVFKFSQAWFLTEDKSFYGKEIVFFDIETTGLKPSEGEIVEIGAIKTKNGAIVDRFETFVRPEDGISAEYTKIHGITEEMTAGAPGIEEALTQFFDFIGNATLAAHNAKFDVGFIQHYSKKYLGKKVENEVICTLELARELLPGIGHSLSVLCEKYSIVNDNAHRAMSDAKATFAVYRRLASRGNPRMQTFLKTNLDLVALSTIADVVPLINENRVLVKRGLEMIKKSTRPGIVALREALTRGNLTAKDVAWSIAPAVNSAGRLGQADKAARLLMTESDSEARELVAELVAMNDERKERGRRNMEKALAALDEQFDPDKDAVVVLVVPDMERGVTGIIANRILNLAGRPTVVLIDNGEKIARGTARSTSAFNIRAAFDTLSDCISEFGGHAAAAAVSVPVGKIAEFRERLNALIIEQVPAEERRPRVMIDAEVRCEEIGSELLRELEMAEPFGHGNMAPLFCMRSVEVIESRRMGDSGQHLKLLVGEADGPIELVAWNALEEINPEAGSLVDVAFGVEKNEWRGRVRIQCLLEDIKESLIQ